MRNLLADHLGASNLDFAWRLRNAFVLNADAHVEVATEWKGNPILDRLSRDGSGNKLDTAEHWSQYAWHRAVALMLKNGPIVVQAEPDLCALMASTELRIKLGDYRQKSEVIAVEHSVKSEVTGGTIRALTMLWMHSPGRIIVAINFLDGDRNTRVGANLVIGRGEKDLDCQIEEVIKDICFPAGYAVNDDELSCIPDRTQCCRIALNLALLMTVRPYDLSPLPPKVAKNRRGNDDRLAMLAAREAQIVKFRDLIAKPRPQYIECESTGRKLAPHMRLGHWKMQACGEGWKDRRPTWIEPYWTGGAEPSADDDMPPTVIYR